MNNNIFLYKEHFSFSPPYRGEVEKAWENAKDLVAFVDGKEDCHTALLIHSNVAVSFQLNDYHPTKLVFSDGSVRPIQVLRDLGIYTFYLFEEKRKTPTMTANCRIRSGDFIFQIGTEFGIPFTVSLGEIKPIDSVKEIAFSFKDQEDGSALMNRKGEIIGMTLGRQNEYRVGIGIEDVAEAFEILRQTYKKNGNI